MYFDGSVCRNIREAGLARELAEERSAGWRERGRSSDRRGGRREEECASWSVET